MKELTKEEAVSEFREMWRWIAEETKKRKKKIYKSDYLMHKGIGLSGEDTPAGQCYLCEYVEQIKGGYCFRDCPVDWLSESHCVENGSPFMQWDLSEDWKDSYKYAKQISELPEKEVEE